MQEAQQDSTFKTNDFSTKPKVKHSQGKELSNIFCTLSCVTAIQSERSFD